MTELKNEEINLALAIHKLAPIGLELAGAVARELIEMGYHVNKIPAARSELNREETIKALKCCASPEDRCDECPIDQRHKDDCECGRFLAQNALAFIQVAKELEGE